MIKTPLSPPLLPMSNGHLSGAPDRPGSYQFSGSTKGNFKMTPFISLVPEQNLYGQVVRVLAVFPITHQLGH